MEPVASFKETLQFDPSLSQLNPIYIVTFLFLKIHLNMLLIDISYHHGSERVCDRRL
jgi:hypothetical protein